MFVLYAGMLKKYSLNIYIQVMARFSSNNRKFPVQVSA
jgi:hypothetical protein